MIIILIISEPTTLGCGFFQPSGPKRGFSFFRFKKKNIIYFEIKIVSFIKKSIIFVKKTMDSKKKLFFYVLLSLTLILEIILIILFLKGDINLKSFLLIGVSNLLTMILSIFNIRKVP